MKMLSCTIFPWFSSRIFKTTTRVALQHLSRKTVFCNSTCVMETGIKVATEQNLSAMSTISMMVLAGPRYEKPSENGITHFIEHMCFKGFCSMPKAEIEKICHEEGIKLTADTTKELFILTAKCLPTSARIVLDIYSKVLYEMSLNESDMEAEKYNMCLELIESDNNPKKVVFEYLVASAYQGTPLAQPVIGPSCNIKRIDECAIRSFVAKTFDPRNIVIAACGDVKHSEFACLVQEKFCNIGSCTDYNLCQPCRYTGSEVLYRNDAMRWAHVAIAVEAPGFLDRDYLPLLVATEILGSWNRGLGGHCNSFNKMSGIAKAMSSENLCDSIESFYLPFTDTGLWGVYFVAERMQIEDIIYNIQTMWMKTCLSCRAGDVDRARKAACLKFAKKWAGSNNSCRDLGTQIMFKSSRENFQSKVKRIRNMDVDIVIEAVERIVYNQCPVVAAVGPTEGIPEYNRVRSSMYWMKF